MLITTLLAAAALNMAPSTPAASLTTGLACAPGAAGRSGHCLPHPDAAKAAPKQAAAARIVCHPDPTKSIGCFNDKARAAAKQRALAARTADKA